MKLFRRRFSNWWLLLFATTLVVFATILVVVSPLLLIGFFMMNNLAGAIFGPPAIWNQPWHTPSPAEMVGVYRETERDWQDGIRSAPASLQLNGDGSMIVHGLPQSDVTTNCLLSASGTWQIARDGSSALDLTVTRTDSSCTCKIEGLPYGISNEIQIAGHSEPYKLYAILGDPDSGEGVWLQRN